MSLPVKTLLVLLFALLYVAPQQHAGLWPLGYVCLVPLLVAVLRSPRRADVLLAAAGWHLFGVGSVRWLSSFGWVALLVTPILYVWGLFLLVPVLRRVRAALALPLWLLVPVLFTAFEWLRIRLSPGQLSIAMLGYSQVKLTPLIQVVDVTGVYGLSFFLAAWNGWLAEAALAATGGREALVRARRPLAVGLGALLAATTGLLAYGSVRDTDVHRTPGPRLAVVQPNVPHYAGDRREDNRRSYDLQVIYTLSKVPPGSADLVLWPENALLDLFEERGAYAEGYARDLERLTRALGAGLVVDAAELPDGSDGWTYHTVFHVGRDGRVREKSRKVYLLPWTEFVPFADALDWVFLGERFRALVRGVVGFVPYGRHGRLDEVRAFTLEWEGGSVPFGVPVCFEAATPGLTRALVARGARFLVNVASEGLLGASVYRQTLIINAFRAVETRTPVVRATNTGISAFLDANGRVQSVLVGEATGRPVNDHGVLVDRVPLDARAGTTFYARHGDVFAGVTVALTALLLAAAELLRRLRPPAPGARA